MPIRRIVVTLVVGVVVPTMPLMMIVVIALMMVTLNIDDIDGHKSLATVAVSHGTAKNRSRCDYL